MLPKLTADNHSEHAADLARALAITAEPLDGLADTRRAERLRWERAGLLDRSQPE